MPPAARSGWPGQHQGPCRPPRLIPGRGPGGTWLRPSARGELSRRSWDAGRRVRGGGDARSAVAGEWLGGRPPRRPRTRLARSAASRSARSRSLRCAALAARVWGPPATGSPTWGRTYLSLSRLAASPTPLPASSLAILLPSRRSLTSLWTRIWDFLSFILSFHFFLPDRPPGLSL